MQEQYVTPAPKYPARTHRRINRRLEELLGHIRTAALVDDVRGGEQDLEGYDEEDEEAHARSRCGDGWEQTSAYLRRIQKYDLPPSPGLGRTEDRRHDIPLSKWPCRFSVKLRCDDRRVSWSWLKRLL